MSSKSGEIISIKANGIVFPVDKNKRINWEDYPVSDDAGWRGQTANYTIIDDKTGKKVNVESVIVSTKYEPN